MLNFTAEEEFALESMMRSKLDEIVLERNSNEFYGFPISLEFTVPGFLGRSSTILIDAEKETMIINKMIEYKVSETFVSRMFLLADDINFYQNEEN